MTDRYDALSPKDLIITLRSLPRRFGSVAGAVRSDPDLFGRVDEPGPGGTGFGEILSHTARRVAALSTEALHLTSQVDPTVSAAALAGGADTRDREPLERSTASIEGNAEALADALDRQDADRWAQPMPLDTGGTIDLITVVRSTVREAIEGLRAAEAQLDHLRRSQDS